MKRVLPLLLIAAVTMLIAACSAPVKPATDVPVLKGEISEKTARRLVKNYDAKADSVTKDKKKYPDSRCIWFSLVQLQELVANISKEKGDGVRFYLAAYDKTTQSDIKINEAYLDYTTLVMVSTYPDGNGKHFDYYVDRTKQGAMFMANPQNQGELCPPPEKCDNIGAYLLSDSTRIKK